MKLGKLTIENIASIEKTEIDFNSAPLSDCEVFLITGPTGAGKTTILDAICLALYADTPRLATSQMNAKKEEREKGEIGITDARQMLRRHAGDGSVTLTFTGNNGIYYEAIWAVQRAHRKPEGNLQGERWSWTRNPGSPDELTLTKRAEIQAEQAGAIGLGFNQFCRTTMLAQGQFSRFLNSKDNEKAEILEKLTGVDIYSRIGRKVFDLTACKKEAYTTAREKIGMVEILSEEATAELQNAIAAHDGRLKELTSRAKQLDAILLWFSRRAELQRNRAAAVERLAQAEAEEQKEEHRANALVVKEWNETIETRALLGKIREADATLARQSEALQRLKGDFATLRGGAAALSMTVEGLEKLRREKLEPTHAAAAKAFQETGETAEKRTEELTAREAALEALKLPALREEQSRLEERYHQIKAAQQFALTVVTEQERARQREGSIALHKQRIAEAEEQVKALGPRLEAATLAAERLRKLYASQREAVGDWAQAMRASLHEGDDCPVCRRRIDAPLPAEEAIRQLVSRAEEAWREADRELQTVKDEKTAREALLKAERLALAQEEAAHAADRHLAKAQKALAEGLAALSLSAPDELTSLLAEVVKQGKAIKEQIAKAEEVEREVKAIRKSVEAERRRVDKLREEAAKAEKRVNDNRTDVAAKRTQVQSVESQLAAIAALLPDHDAAEPVAKQVEGLDSDLIRLHGELKTSLALTGEANAAKALAEAQLSRSEFDRDRLTSLNRYSQAQIQALVEAQKRVAEAIVIARTNLQGVEKALAELTEPENLGEATAESTAEARRALEPEMEALRMQRAEADQRLKTAEANRRRLSELIVKAEQAEADWQRWEALNRLIGDAEGKKFRKIALSYVLASLVNAANHYMRTLTNRYTLHVEPGTYIISIEDAWQGFARRPATTISGGETFLVSLSLALALSDIGTTLAVDTLFIDEGFGTLSEEALQSAVTTLRTLHSNAGRRVGIISHVEQLRHRIPIQLTLTPRASASTLTLLSS